MFLEQQKQQQQQEIGQVEPVDLPKKNMVTCTCL